MPDPKSIQPIRPSDLASGNPALPEGVIQAFNEMIAENLSGRSSTFAQNKVVARIKTHMNVGPDNPFDIHWLDVEPLFRSVGWKVEYDKPGFNETYEARFTFRMPRDK